MKLFMAVQRRHIFTKAGSIMLIGLIGGLQVIGSVLVGISAVVLKTLSVLMIGAAGILFLVTDFSGWNTFVLVVSAALFFWLPELFGLLLVLLTMVQVKLKENI